MKTSAIRPIEAMIDQRVSLAKDIAYLETRTEEFIHVSCPACASEQRKFLFSKYGLNSNSCSDCGTQYISPRPSAETLAEFYKQSHNYSFWADKIFKDTSAKRMESIFRPRAIFIKNYCKEYLQSPLKVLEVGAAYGYFLDAITEKEHDAEIVCIEPTPKLAKILTDKGYQTIEDSYEDVRLKTKFSLVTAFEVIEHLYDPKNFLDWARDLMIDKGLIYLTCPNIEGFETQILGRHSDTIDHEHLNLFNPNGIDKLLKRSGFKALKISTPGQLDTDIVWNFFNSHPAELTNSEEFIFKGMMNSEEKREKLQALLVSMNLSTHMSIVAQKS